MQPLLLTERRARLCRLPRAEVEWLQEHARNVMAVEPTLRPGWYRLTAAGVMGTLATPWRSIVVRSRMGDAVLPWFLGLATSPAAGQVANPWDGIARLLAERLAAIGRVGLHREYRETAEQGPFLVGRLDVPAQLRELRRDTLHSLPQYQSMNISCNQVPVCLAQRLLQAPLHPLARAELGDALTAWAGVSPLPGPLPEQPPPGYESLFQLCRWLLVGPGQGHSSLLVSLPRVFEALVARIAQGAAQHSVVVCPGLILRPDVTLFRHGQPYRVADAKWKRLPPDPADLYQAVTYAVALGVTEAVLVYPGQRRDTILPIGPVRVRVTTLRVTGSLESCQRSERRLRRILRRGL